MTKSLLFSLVTATLLVGVSPYASAKDAGRPDKDRFTRAEIAAACAARNGVAVGTDATSGSYSCHTDRTWILCPDQGACSNGRHENPARIAATAWPFDPAADPNKSTSGRRLTAWPWAKAAPGDWPFWQDVESGALVNLARRRIH